MKKICLIIICIFSIMTCSGCYKDKMLKYYSNDKNYSRIICRIEDIYKFEDNYVCVKLSGANGNELNCNEFCIIPRNYDVLSENGFFDKIKISDEIQILAAIQVFGDGYDIPIVEIEFNGECYLDFETGKENLLKYVEETEN